MGTIKAKDPILPFINENQVIDSSDSCWEHTTHCLFSVPLSSPSPH